MNAVLLINILVVAILLVFLYSGYKQGFLRKLIGIFTFFVAGFISWYVSGYLSQILSLYPLQESSLLNQYLYDSLNRITLFVILFLLLQFLLLFLRPIAKLGNHVPVVSLFNRFVGVALGGIQALLILFLITMGLRLPLWKEGSALVETSLLRYGDPLSDIILFYTQEPVQELQKVKQALEQKQALTTEEIQRLRVWLLDKNINEEDADKILSMLRVE